MRRLLHGSVFITCNDTTHESFCFFRMLVHKIPKAKGRKHANVTGKSFLPFLLFFPIDSKFAIRDLM